MPEDEITENWEFISPVTQETIIHHPTGRTIQSITIISFDPLAAACLCHQSNKFNLYHTLIEGITNREWLSKKALIKCYYTEWITEMAKDLLSNLVSARTCTLPKSISYSNKEEWRGKHKQSGRLAQALPHLPASQIDSMDADLPPGTSHRLEFDEGIEPSNGTPGRASRLWMKARQRP